MKKQLDILFKNHVEILLFFVLLIVLRNFQNSHLQNGILQMDSFRYISISKLDLFSLDFWFSSRPMGFPLIIKMFGTGFLFCIFQTVFYFLSWIFFYRSLKIINPKIHRDILLSIIVLMIAFLNTPFDDLIFNIMTEPINFSLILVIVSCLFRLIVQFDDKIFSLFLFCLSWFSLFKDGNNMMIPFFVLSAFLISFPKKQLSILSLVMSVFLFYSWKGINNQDLGMYQRWVFPMLNNFSQRVLTHKDWEKFSDREHIPKSEGKLLEMKGKWAFSDSHKFYKSPEFSDFRVWFLKHGKTSYLRFLIGYPINTIKIIFSGFKSIPSYYFYLVFLFWILLKVFFTSWRALKAFRSFILLSFSLFIMSFAVSGIYIVGDAMEIFRHILPCILMFFISLLGLGVILDKTGKGSWKPL